MSDEQPRGPEYRSPQQAYLPGPVPQYQPQSNANGKAVASMVTGIISLVVPFVGIVTGPLAIVLAARARGEIQRTRQKGDGLAVTGLVTGIIGCVGYGIFLLMMVIGAIASAATVS